MSHRAYAIRKAHADDWDGLEVLGVVDDTLRVVLVLERREAVGVGRIVLLMRDVGRVRAVDVVHCGTLDCQHIRSMVFRGWRVRTILLEEGLGLVVLNRSLHALDERNAVRIRHGIWDRAVVLDRVKRVTAVEGIVVRADLVDDRLATAVEVTVHL